MPPEFASYLMMLPPSGVGDYAIADVTHTIVTYTHLSYSKKSRNLVLRLQLSTVNALLSPLSQISPPFFQGKKVKKTPVSPPPYYSSVINDRLYNSITASVTTSFGLIQDGLFRSWKVGFVFDPRLHELQLPVLSFSTLHSSSLWKADTTIFAKLNKPSLSSMPPSNVFEINKPPPPPGGLIEDLR